MPSMGATVFASIICLLHLKSPDLAGQGFIKIGDGCAAIALGAFASTAHLALPAWLVLQGLLC